MPGGRRAIYPKADRAQLEAYARGQTDQVPIWYCEPDHARRLNVSLLELWWLVEYGGFSERYGHFLTAWGLEAAHADERQQAQQQEARLQRDGWQGGPTDPRASGDYKGPTPWRAA